MGVYDAVGDLDLVDGVAGERDADGVPDALLEQDADPDRALDGAGAGRTRLGNAQVQWVGDLVRDRPVGGDHRGRIGRLHRDLDQVEVERLEDMDVAERRADHRRHHFLRRRANARAFLGTTGERTRVDADADRHLALLRPTGDLF